MSRTFAPNFYSDNLCRKVNNSHEKKTKNFRRNKKVISTTLNEDADSSDFTNSTETSPSTHDHYSNFQLVNPNLIQTSNVSLTGNFSVNLNSISINQMPQTTILARPLEWQDDNSNFLSIAPRDSKISFNNSTANDFYQNNSQLQQISTSLLQQTSFLPIVSNDLVNDSNQNNSGLQQISLLQQSSFLPVLSNDLVNDFNQNNSQLLQMPTLPVSSKNIDMQQMSLNVLPIASNNYLPRRNNSILSKRKSDTDDLIASLNIGSSNTFPVQGVTLDSLNLNNKDELLRRLLETGDFIGYLNYIAALKNLEQ